MTRMQTRAAIVPAMLACLAVLSPLSCDEDDEERVAADDDDSLAGQCPTHIRTRRIRGHQDARLDIGWTGGGHAATQPDGLNLSLELFDCDEECRICRVRGPVDNVVGVSNRRCINDLGTACVSDAECGDGGECRYIYLSPTTITGTSYFFTFLEPLTPDDAEKLGVASFEPVQGVFDTLTGELDFNVFNNRVALGSGIPANCIGDISAEDGVKDGTCEDTGTPCDVHSTGVGSIAFSWSFDCDYRPVTIDYPTVLHGMGTTGVRWTMDDSRPLCSAEGVEDQHCWCGACDNDPTLPCQSDDDCNGGTCTNAANAVLAKNNACVDECQYDEATNRGTCTNVNGNPLPCFPNGGTIDIRGSNLIRDDFYVATLAVLSCAAESENPITDVTLGLPGIVYAVAPTRIDLEYRE